MRRHADPEAAASPIADEYVRRMRDLLDGVEAMLWRAPAAGFDTTEALDDVATLHRLLDLGGAVVALAITTAWGLDREMAQMKRPEPRSHGGKLRAGKYQLRDLRLWQTAQRECPTRPAKSDRAAALWLSETGKAGEMDAEKVRKALGRIRRKLATS